MINKSLVIKIVAPLIVFLMSVLAFTAISSPTVEAQEGTNTAACTDVTVLGLKPWHYYLNKTAPPECDILAPNGILEGSIPWLIAASILESMLAIATYIAVIFVFIGGYQILTSSGNPDAVAGGRRKIVAAIVGFIIAVTSSSVVGFLLNELTSGNTAEGLPTVADEGRSVLNILFSLAYRIAAGLAVIYVAIAGIQFATSGGDPGKVAKARNNIIYASVGLAIVLLSVAIIAFIGGQL